MSIHVTPLGAGQQVGKSCILLEIAGKRVLFDCGVSPGAKSDAEKYPDLSLICPKWQAINKAIDVVVVSHYHLDHIAALPFLTETLGYTGPLLMTHPTRAIGPVICTDFVKHAKNHRSRARYTYDDVRACFSRATCMHLHERVELEGGLAITPYYAGHVLGAVMVLVEYRGKSAFYTGDFTMVAEHYLHAARFPSAVRPDVLITESTCCTTIRSSNRLKEHEFCRRLEETLSKGGNVLVPTSSLGRAQELCLICDKYWEQAGLSYEMILVRGMAERGVDYMRIFSSWASDLVRGNEEPFHYNHVRLGTLEEIWASDSPKVVFSGPSMLQGGPSLELFKRWAPEKRNLLCFTGYCLPGTVGNMVQAKLPKVRLDDGTTVPVHCAVEYLSHSDHTDSRGIVQLVSQLAPRHVVLVHGTGSMMQMFKPIIEKRLRISCSTPDIGERLDIPGSTQPMLEVVVSPSLAMRSVPQPDPPAMPAMAMTGTAPAIPHARQLSQAVLCSGKRGPDAPLELLELDERGLCSAGWPMHRLRFRQEAPAMAVLAVQAAWHALRRSAQGSSLDPRWEGREPAWNDFQAAGQKPQRLRLSPTACLTLRPKGSSGVVHAVFEWSPADEAAHPCVAELAAALTSGG